MLLGLNGQATGVRPASSAGVFSRVTETMSPVRPTSFVVSWEDEKVLEEAIQRVAAGLGGTSRRGRALAHIAKTYIER